MLVAYQIDLVYQSSTPLAAVKRSIFKYLVETCKGHKTACNACLRIVTIIMSERIWETDFTSTFHHSTYPSIAPTRPELSAAGKTVFITGGGRGIGTGMVKAFAEAGAANIIVAGRSPQSLQAVAASTAAVYPSTRVTIVTGDVSVDEDVARMFAEVKNVAPGGVDVVIANAAYLPEVMPIPPASGEDKDKDKAATADWWQAFEVNTKGVYLLARHFLASASASAVFVNVSTVGSHITPALAGFSPYAGSKLGAVRVVETLQIENQESGLRFYSVHPGTIKSDMLEKSHAEELGSALPLDDGKS